MNDLDFQAQINRELLGFSRHGARIAALQSAVRSAEAEQRDRGTLYYDALHVKQSIVNTREDLVLAIGHLSELHRTVLSIRRLALAGIVLLASLVAHSLGII
jgi:hypothetical protein